MLAWRIKSGIRSLLWGFGFDVRRIGAGEPGIDAQSDFARLIGSNSRPVIFDVGANVGQTIDALLNTFPNATIHSFEPGSDAFQILNKNYAGKLDIHLNNMALGPRPGRLEFIESVGQI